MNFPSIRIEGAILSADLLDKIARDEQFGQRPVDFGLAPGAKVKDEIAAAWADTKDMWRIYQRRLSGLKEGATGVSETRSLWIVPLLGVLGHRAEIAKAESLNGKSYAISHRLPDREGFPIHIMGCNDSLDKKRESGGPRMSPHGLLQEYLNLTEHLYGLVSNGHLLRLLRNSSRLIRLSFLEFDLERMVEDDLFADFAILYRLLHVTRFPAHMADAPECWLEKYHQDSLDAGSRIREGLSFAVEDSILLLANGFLAHPENDRLREALTNPADPTDAATLYHQLLRLVYRLLFLFVIEDRDLVFPPDSDRRKRDIFYRYYSLQRLRRLAENRHLDEERYQDHWQALRQTFRLFESGDHGEPLGIQPLAGDLFDPNALGVLGVSQLRNDALLACLRKLCMFQHPQTHQRMRVNYAALNVEEFGSVYEGLLEYDAKISGLETNNQQPATNNSLRFQLVKGEGRAETGSHYTPDDLVQPLIRHSLDYLIADKLEESGREASGEWRVASGEDKTDKTKEISLETKKQFSEAIHGILSRSGSVETWDGSHGLRLQIEQILAQRGIIWPHQPNAQSRQLHSSQSGGRMGPENTKIVSTIHTDRQRQSPGTGDASPLSGETQASLPGTTPGTIQGSDHSRETITGTAQKPGETDSEWRVEGEENSERRDTSHHSPLPTPHSLLATIWTGLPFAIRHSLLASQALLGLRVADIACGSGHILLAAARRIAHELATVRTGEEQPSPASLRLALRDVIRTCIYGVDLNPQAVELCKVALWLEAHIPGEPLNFLDHHIQCGNAIVGFVHSKELEQGIPDEAFKTLSDDDKDTAKRLRDQNKNQRKESGLPELAFEKNLLPQLQQFQVQWNQLAELPESTPEEINAKKEAFRQLTQNARSLRQTAHLPIAQFYLSKTPENQNAITTHRPYIEQLQGIRPLEDQRLDTAEAIAGRKFFFHWFLAFPEIIQRGGFDCILGNPPYLGGQALSGTYGHTFCEYVKWQYAPTGLSELLVFFLRRIHTLLRPRGFTAFITTNSIKDGDVRKDGLEQIQVQGSSINFAVRGIKWPGMANLVVSLIGIHRGPWKGPFELDGKIVPTISPFLEDSEDLGEPDKLEENKDKVFQGSIFLGDGFLLTHEKAAELITTNPKNQEVIFPLINGREINNEPDQKPGRSIVNFFDWDEDQAREYSEPFSIVEEKVKPSRSTQKRKRNREVWWVYAEHRPGLCRELEKISLCFTAAATTKYLNFSATTTDIVFTHALYVFTTDRWDLFSVVQSTLHEVWARKYSGALETRLRYSPSDCFSTFAFPDDIWTTAHPDLEALGERYHEHRQQLMLDLWIGLTDTYNLFHDPALDTARIIKVAKCDPAKAEDGIRRIQQLRDLHRDLDHAVRDAYRWTDLPLEHDFHDIETLPENDRTRYTISPTARKELLKRLLLLNHQRHEEEAAAGVHDKKGTKEKKRKNIPEKKSISSASGLPNVSIPNQLRLPAKDTTTYLMQFILRTIDRVGGKVRLVDLARAYVLLKHRDIVNELASGTEIRSAVKTWANSFSEAIDETEFSTVLKQMALQRREIALEGTGRHVTVSATVFAVLPPDPTGWRSIDAQIVWWAATQLEPAVFDQADISLEVEKIIIEFAA
jgi:hypothetical protein